MQAKIANALASLGQSVTLRYQGETVSFLGCLQPSLSKEISAHGAGGYGTTTRYTLYAPFGKAGPLLKKGAQVTSQGEEFLVERCDEYSLSGRVLYYRARLLRLERPSAAQHAITPKALPRPAPELAPQPATKPITEPVTQPVTEPITKFLSESVEKEDDPLPVSPQALLHPKRQKSSLGKTFFR